MLLFMPASIISNNNIHTISVYGTKQQIARDANDSVCLFIEKVEDVFLLRVAFLAVFVVVLAFADR